MKINYLVQKIKDKKLLKSLDDSVVRNEIKRYFLKNPQEIDKLHEKNVVKKVVKEIRKNLRGFEEFQTRKDYAKLTKEEILKIHKSTKERFPYYGEVYKKIFKITGKPKSVLDLGCGVNPLSLLDKRITYYASDIGRKELDLIDEYFEKNKINGETFFYDLKNVKKNLPNVSVVFLFKVLDAIEKNGHKLAEKIIKSLDAKYVVISFSTSTVSGKKMKYSYRGWMERMLERLKLKYEKFEIPNEVFYVVRL